MAWPSHRAEAGPFRGERELVGVLLRQCPGRLAHPVSGPGIHPQQDRGGAGLAVLQLGTELERMGRYHPVVVITGADQRSLPAMPDCGGF